jgi:hypothetical protein
MNQSTNSQRFTGVAIALILMGACAAKTWAMISESSPVTRWDSLFNVLLVQAELLLALWLISGSHSDLCFATSALFFVGAIAANLRSIWLRKSSCGCFGNIEIPPEATLVLNIAILSAIALAIRSLTVANMTTMLRIGRIGRTVPLCIGILIVVAFVQMGRIHFTPKLLSMPDKIDLGVIELGTYKEIFIPLKNIAGKEINIWGGKTTCSCATITGLPTSVPKDSETEVRIVVKPNNLRDINVQAMFYANSGFSDRFVTLTATVRDSNESK